LPLTFACDLCPFRRLVFAEKGHEEDKAGDKKEETSRHRPKTANTCDDEGGGRKGEQDPPKKIDLPIGYFAAPIGALLKAKAHIDLPFTTLDGGLDDGMKKTDATCRKTTSPNREGVFW